MEFDKSKVYTALNVDESLIGAKGYFADSILTLKTIVEHNFKVDCQILSDFKNDCFMHNDKHIFNFFYLVEPAEKWYVYENNFVLNDGKIIYELVNNNWAYTGEPIFSGSKEKCNQWIKEHSKPKYRPFKDCDELIKVFYDRHFIVDLDWTLPTIWVKTKKLNTLQASVITNFDKTAIDLSYTSVSLQYLFDNFTFLDGSVCGVEEE